MYCLRCGRQIPEGTSFCDACKETVSQPLGESPFLSTRIVLPARVAAKSPVKPMPEIKKKKEQERVKSKRLITAVVLLSLLCALLTAACGYGVKLWLDGRREHRLLLTAQEENGRLTAQISAKDDEIDVQKDKVSQLSAQLDELASEITHLEQQINAYKMQGSEVDQSLRRCSTRLRICLFLTALPVTSRFWSSTARVIKKCSCFAERSSGFLWTRVRSSAAWRA